jgi:hypothetical protein
LDFDLFGVKDGVEGGGVLGRALSIVLGRCSSAYALAY